jgi:hypothetical protein
MAADEPLSSLPLMLTVRRSSHTTTREQHRPRRPYAQPSLVGISVYIYTRRLQPQILNLYQLPKYISPGNGFFSMFDLNNVLDPST